VNIALHAGPEVEIEDDVVRLQRRKLDYEADAARRTGSDRLRTTLAGTATQAVSKRMAVGRMFSSLIRRLRRRAALRRIRHPREDRPVPIPRIRWYS
jgi:hypothetical protein